MSNEKSACSEKDMMVCLQRIMIPVAMLALTVSLFFGYQTTQILKEKTSLEKTYHLQEEPLKNVDHMSRQLSGLIVGMKKLTDENNPHAKEILEKLVAETQNSARAGNRGAMYLLDRMVAGGILRVEKPAGAAGAEAPKPPVPEAAMAPAVPAPVKP